MDKGYKIKVQNTEESKRAQDVFFKLGGRWSKTTKINKYEFTKQPCLYFDKFKNICFSDDTDTFFDDQEETEVTLQELEELEEVLGISNVEREKSESLIFNII